MAHAFLKVACTIYAACESYGRLARLSIHSLFSNLVSVHVLVEDVFCSAPIDQIHIMKTFIHSKVHP